MSLAAIQDNLLKTSLVQQTQSRSDDVNRGQEIAAQAGTKEMSRQADQVVLHTNQKNDESGIKDEEKEKERRRRQKEEEEEEERREQGEEEDDGPRARMRTINIVI